MKIQKIAATLLLGALPLFSATTITVKGSDTMVILAQRWAEAYMAANPDVTIQVTGGGSGVGISALINGATDICNSSRPMKASEFAACKAKGVWPFTHFNRVHVVPPCNTSPADVERGIAVLDEALEIADALVAG